VDDVGEKAVDTRQLVASDPELWLFTSVYRALEAGEIAPSQFLELLKADLRSDLNSRARSLAEDGNIALASLVKYGTVKAAEQNDFVFRSYQQEWWSLITSELQKLEERLEQHRTDLASEIVSEIEAQLFSTSEWIRQYRYDRATSVLEKCVEILRSGVEKVEKDLRAQRQQANSIVENARTHFQDCTPLHAGNVADSLARQLINQASELTLARRPDLEQIGQLTRLAMLLCDAQQSDESLIKQARDSCAEGYIVPISVTKQALEADEQAIVRADQILKNPSAEDPLPRVDPTAWHDREVYLNVGANILDKPILVGLLLRTDMALCPEPSNDERVWAPTRKKIQQEVDTLELKYEAQPTDTQQLQHWAALLLRAAKATLLSFPTWLPDSSQARKIHQYLTGYCLLYGDYLFSARRYDAARDYYMEAFQLNQDYLDLPVRDRVPNFLRSFGLDPLKISIEEKTPGTTVDRIEHWIGQAVGKLDDDRARYLVRVLLLADDVEDLQDAVNRLFSEPSSRFRLLCEKTAQLLGIQDVDDPAPIGTRLRQVLRAERQTLQQTFADLLHHSGTSQDWTQAYSLVQHLMASYKVDDTTLWVLDRLEALVGEALGYATTTRFEDRDNLVRRIENGASQIGKVILGSPTYLARCYLHGYVFKLWNAVKAMHDETRVAAAPELDFSVVKVHRLKGEKHECHIDVKNVGQTTAMQVIITPSIRDNRDIFVESSDEQYFTLASGQTKTISVPIRVVPPLTTESIDLEIAYELIDRDRKRHTGGTRIRVDLRPSSRFEPIAVLPYVTGGVVHDERVFVGRDQLIDGLIREVATSPHTNAALILGQKRSGKSSILYHLRKRSPKSVIPVIVSLHSVLLDSTRGDLIASLFEYIANAIVDECDQRNISIDELSWDVLIQPPGPAIQFERWLRRINGQMGLRPLILFDEFNELVARIENGLIPAEIMKKFKQLIEQGYFSCIIAGTDQMADALKRFANELAVSKPHWVDYLDAKSARKLIEDPIRLEDSSSRFSSDAVIDEVIGLTAGSPYLIQILCSRLVTYINDNQVAVVTGADLDRVVDASIAEADLSRFEFLCRYKEDPKNDDFDSILEGLFLFLLADETQKTGMASRQALLQRAPFVRVTDLERIANSLESRRVIEAVNPDGMQRYNMVVSLFQRWLTAKRPMDEARKRGFEQRLEEHHAS
jgi:tetratricopeptide (TPR) repeat protein